MDESGLTKEKTILIVDDSYANRALLKKLFSEEYNVLEAENGLNAIKIVKEKNDITLIILDLMMPVMDGYEVLRRLHDNKQYSEIPTIVITANDNPESQIQALAEGAVDYIIKPFNSNIVIHRVQNIIYRRETARISEQNRIYKLRLRQQEQMLKLSETDPRTGIYNGQAFCSHTQTLIQKNTDRRYLIIRWDIDRFKAYNEIYGTSLGDKYLADVGSFMSGGIFEDTIYGYLGADHFAVCMEARRFSENDFYGKVSEYIHSVNPDFEFVIRIGVYIINDTDTEVSLMCDRAMLALKSLKENDTKFTAYYDESMSRDLIMRQNMLHEFREAVENDRFTFHLQPKIDIHDKTTCGAEVLVRWKHPERGMIAPLDFIPPLEENGQISKLDMIVWDKSCALIKKWSCTENESIPLSVNISHMDIHNPRLAVTLGGIAENYGIDPSMLHLEITESAYDENPEQLALRIAQLKKRGFIIELDGFGCGRSSLKPLRDLPADIIVVDMRFITEEKINGNGSIIMRYVSEMASKLGVTVVAKNVETELQAKFAFDSGCSVIQGYFCSKPLTTMEFEKYLKN